MKVALLFHVNYLDIHNMRFSQNMIVCILLTGATMSSGVLFLLFTFRFQTQHQVLLNQRSEPTAKEQTKDRRAPDAAATDCYSSWSSSICRHSSQPDCDAHKDVFFGRSSSLLWSSSSMWQLHEDGLEDKWVLHLLPLLSGEAQLASQQLLSWTQLEYQSTRIYLWCFLTLKVLEFGRPTSDDGSTGFWQEQWSESSAVDQCPSTTPSSC